MLMKILIAMRVDVELRRREDPKCLLWHPFHGDIYGSTTASEKLFPMLFSTRVRLGKEVLVSLAVLHILPEEWSQSAVLADSVILGGY